MASTTSTTDTPNTPPSPPPPPSNDPPILTLPRVTIRPYHPTDAPHSAHQANDPSIAANMRNTFPSPYSPRDAEHFIGAIALAATSTNPLQPEGVRLHYAICRSGDGAFAGGIGLKPLRDVEARTLEVGYWVGREHRGKGYATEAVRGFSDWAFATFPGVLRLEASVFEGNGASEAVLLKAGYQREGVRRKAVWKNDRALDLVYFGLLREEWSGLGSRGVEGHEA
ncbi:hypothetical protein VPNG_00191 [Cytospora leucostoma]|uniref:N-acetyltransferase domain-containing protein n=1 Tax=Cytospora leucostoma TaxID=1230097 RepID=A0A423XPB4_9PEZI|nr:hypothetical protein VPNG_00191 [Cytospora leucostoma]